MMLTSLAKVAAQALPRFVNTAGAAFFAKLFLFEIILARRKMRR
jgi:hypothetical protein